MDRETILNEAKQSIMDCDSDKALQILENAKGLKFDLVDLLTNGYSEGIKEAGELFASGEIFLPELIFMTEIMKKVSKIVEESLGSSAITKKGTLVIATVEGDVHDIGKGIVASLLKTSGIEVYDLGREVSVDTIIAKAEEYNADIIATSALLTTTMTVQKKLEDALNERGLRSKYKTMVGGAPVTKRWADKIGADGYSEDAAEAIILATQLLAK
jgi:trimethylamine corrinoid protein